MTHRTDLHDEIVGIVKGEITDPLEAKVDDLAPRLAALEANVATLRKTLETELRIVIPPDAWGTP